MVMNRLLQKLALCSLLSFSLCSITAQGNIFLNVAQEQVNKISKKPVKHKPSLEFKQAIARYIKHTDVQCFANMQRHTDENISYKKELRYLFKSYGKFSAVTLLARLRSAHQAMVKYDINVEGESYKKYEQICSALLLTCTQVFFNDARNQILNALHEIDNLLVYWRYQQNHQVKYFFSKSPMKWIVGKDQEKEIVQNIIKLERKQRELYTLLGSLTGHIHLFAETGTTYETCYTWIEELFEMTPCIKTSDYYTHDETRFDIIAGKLELKLKRVAKFKEDCLSSLAGARKPNHFVRNWMAYATAAAIAGYVLHYHSNNPLVLGAAFERTTTSIQGIGKSVVVDPMMDLWKVFFETKSENSITSVEAKVEKIEEYAGLIEAKVAILTDPKIQSLNGYSKELLGKVLTRMKTNGVYYLDKENVKCYISDVEKERIIQEVMVGNLGELSKVIEGTSLYYYDEKVDLGIVNILLMLDDVLKLLQKYPELIDEGILPLVKEIGFLFADFGKITSDLLKNNFWTVKLAAFTPLAGACFCISKAYQWTTTRDYSPIRIALADVNSLLIESATHLDDYDYGKLVYLICKLRHRSTYLKDPLSNEFLSDVTKLESKQYSAQIKRGIVENMFNKYAFLGRIAV